MKKCSFADIPESASDRLMGYFTNNLNLNTEDIEKLSIGLTVILLNIFEMTLVFILSFFLGVIKETLIFSIMFTLLRTLGSGVHCKTSSQCITVTLTFYIGAALLSKYFPVNTVPALCISLICTAFLYKYAPADTENRPILGERHRKKLKIEITIMALLIILANLIIADNALFNPSMYAMVIETIIVLPCTYKLMNVNYNNYKLYE